jgi:Tol biopolymer transport system component
MSLKAGVRLGPYEVMTPVGAGGMGEVYRARDPRLGRDVAVKVLPPAFSTDPERLARFEQEARAAAALNHPNILAVHDVGQHEGSSYIVSELLDGQSLRERLVGGALPVRKAVEYAVQVAHGLAAAHEKGIVHRDLKPENIFITHDGRVKILDFGLAKLTQPDSAASGLSALPTTPPNTQAGIVLGTVGYMSPEQVRGLVADHRSDIFALGVLLYEMLAGQRAFHGETTMDAMTAILKEDPPDLPVAERHIPPALERIVDRCLEKSPAARFQSTRDLAFALEALSASGPTESLGAVVAPRTREWLAWTTAALLAVVTAVLAAAWAFGSRATAPEMRLEITTPPTFDQVSLAISPDGEKLVFVASADGRPQLWLRSLRSGAVRLLPGTEGASFPFWSPDSQSIGFFANERLNRIDIDGGSLRALARAPVGAGGSWSPEGVIVFPSVPDAPMMRVSAGGGNAVLLPGSEPGQGGNRFPQFLPDGRHFLYYMADAPKRGVYVGTLDAPERRKLFDADSAAVFVPPALVLFIRAGTLVAQRFDPVRLTLEGNTVALADGVNVDTVGIAAVSASATGSIVYRVGSANRQRQLAWFDRSGKRLGNANDPDAGNPLNPSLSPDGRLVAFNRSANGNADIWLLELGRGALSRFTSDPTPDIYPIWSPDGRWIVYGGAGGGQGFKLVRRSTFGSNTGSTLLDTADTLIPLDWSRDGRFLLYRKIGALLPRQDASLGSDIWARPMDRDGAAFPVAQTRSDERTGQFSPDGRWVAFESDESGRYEIHVQQFPEPSTRTVVSIGGGLQPRWGPDGKELFYIAPDGQLMTVAVRFSSDGKTIEPASPVPLFRAHVGSTLDGGSGVEYIVSADGQRFLMNTLTEEAAAPITLILNWAGISE